MLCMAYVHDDKIIRVLNKVGIASPTKLLNTLQGSIWRGCNKSENESVVVKVTDQFLHKNHLSVVDGTTYYVVCSLYLKSS